MTKGIALGTKLFTREVKLDQLLRSVPTDIVSKVYVADDGPDDSRSLIRNTDYGVDVEIIDLPFDAGLGRGREAIVEACDEAYLLIVDTDNEVPPTVGRLREILDANPEYGGVGGVLVEDHIVTGLFHDLCERDDGRVLLREFNRDKSTEEVIAGYRVREFDFLENVAMFRTDCLEDYCWDPEYVIGREHLDFYVGHWKHTDWKFAVCPSVRFPHHPGGDRIYTENRHDGTKLDHSGTYFRDKWGYSSVVMTSNWFDVRQSDRPLHPLPTIALPEEWQVRIKRLRDRAGHAVSEVR